MVNEETTARITAEPLRLLYEDEWFVAVHKPEGLLVHRSPLDRHETRFALQEARELTGRYLYPLHRLDRPTSGVLLFAADRWAAKRPPFLPAPRASGENKKRSTPAGTGAPLH